MTIKNNIIELLSRKELNSIQISSELQVPKQNLWVYLKTLVDERKIERINDKKPYKYKSYNDNMNNRLLHDKIDKLEKTLSNLREMFENGVLKVYKEKMNENYIKILEEL